MSRLLLIPVLTAAATAVLLMHASGFALPAQSSTPRDGTPEIDVEAELRSGCERLIAIATSDTPDASWALAELRRAATASWASHALQTQAKQGLDAVDVWRGALAAR